MISGISGAGRTGVFLTLSIALERIRYEGVVDVFQTVKLLRTQRPALVQTEVRLFSRYFNSPKWISIFTLFTLEGSISILLSFSIGIFELV